MKKHIFIITIFTLLSFFKGFSQQISLNNPDELNSMTFEKKIVIDTCVINIHFRQLVVNDTNNLEKKKENYMILQVGKRISKFSDFFILKRDSLNEKLRDEKRTPQEIVNRGLLISKGTISINIYKNFPINKITTTDRVPMSGTYKYTENKVKPLWKIETGSLTVCGYQCKKATTTFRGRNYTVWYAPKISISDGPWKFWGLPGMILKVSDDKGHYSFECISIEKPKSISKIYMLDSNYMITTKAKFNDALRKFNENPGAAIQASGRITGGLPDKIKSRPYNPIELSE